MAFPSDYIERVYAGVLGKIIGVYLGRPFEGWTYEKIMQELGEIWYYVHEKRGVPLIVTDDDISGTFTFLRALPDHGNSPDLTPAQIGQTWLNYLIDRKTILWWGGMGNSTEHTAYLRLKRGIPAPKSGSIELNGPIVAQQIGAQIFIDGWAMVAPGDPQRAADLARRAGSVSHDGEALYGAMCLAAMEAQAFVERDINCLLDTGVSVIPQDSIIYRMIADLREWHKLDGDWRKTFRRIEDHYGYKDFIGGCHMVPNHALIILGLLYGEGDYQKSLMICNTCGWDTDCNSGNLGCLLGIRNGLAGFQGADWRGPVADRMYLPTMDGGRCVSDAVTETYHIVNAARGLQGQPPIQPKNGARFHFELPDSVQGWRVDPAENCAGQVELFNAEGHSKPGSRSLGVRYSCSKGDVAARVTTPTFLLPEDLNMPGYSLIASPTLYSGQTIRAGVTASESNPGPVEVGLVLRYYSPSDQPDHTSGPGTRLAPGEYAEITWTAPEMVGMPIFAVGLEVRRIASEEAAAVADLSLQERKVLRLVQEGKSNHEIAQLLFMGEGTLRTILSGIHTKLGFNEKSEAGMIFVDYLTWDGAARTTFAPPQGSKLPNPGPQVWRMGWVNAMDQWEKWGAPFRLIQNEGRGLITTGTREWADYRVTANVRPALLKAGGLAARVQGQQRFYALELVEGGKVRLRKVYEGQETVLAEAECAWQLWQPCELSLEVKGSRLRGWAGGKLALEYEDKDNPLREGAMGLVVEEGHLMTDAVSVEPA